MNKKRVLMLGGTRQQIPVILKAKEMGLYVITCDYLPDNPGHCLGDCYINISTTDKESVFQLAKEEQVDGIICYASDPAAPSAAYAATKLGLSTNPYESVCILTDKEKFRDFLEQHQFATPKAKAFDRFEDLCDHLQQFQYPVMIKPVDSSGSKGVSCYNGKEDSGFEYLKHLYEEALLFSRRKKVLVEEFVGIEGYQIAGDGFSVDGELVFSQFGDDHFSKDASNPFVPVAASFPTTLSLDKQEQIRGEIQRLFTLLQMKTGAYNFDIRYFNNKVYLMEIGPRNGGNYIPQLIQYSTGADMVKATIQAALGDEVHFNRFENERNCCYYAVFSKKSGFIQELSLDLEFASQHLLEVYWNKKVGDRADQFTGSDKALGILLLKFESQRDMLHQIQQMDRWITIKIEDGLEE